MKHLRIDKKHTSQYIAFIVALLLHILLIIFIWKIAFEIKFDLGGGESAQQADPAKVSYFTGTQPPISQDADEKEDEQAADRFQEAADLAEESAYGTNEPEVLESSVAEPVQDIQKTISENTIIEDDEAVLVNLPTEKISEAIQETVPDIIPETIPETITEAITDKKTEKKVRPKRIRRRKKRKLPVSASQFVNAFTNSYRAEQEEEVFSPISHLTNKINAKNQMDMFMIQQYLDSVQRASAKAVSFTPGNHIESLKNFEKELTVDALIGQNGEKLEIHIEPQIEYPEALKIITNWIHNIKFPPLPDCFKGLPYRHKFKVKVDIKAGKEFYLLKLG